MDYSCLYINEKKNQKEAIKTLICDNGELKFRFDDGDDIAVNSQPLCVERLSNHFQKSEKNVSFFTSCSLVTIYEILVNFFERLGSMQNIM